MSVFRVVVETLLLVMVLVIAGLALFSAYTARRVSQILPPIGSFVDVDGARVHYIDRRPAGISPRSTTLLLIHGLGAQIGNFTHSLVERLTTEYRVVVIDRPGAGHSSPAPGASAGICAQARTLAGFIRAIGLARPVVVGHSLGGTIALGLALDHPELVAALALVSPFTQVEDKPPPAFEALAIESPLRRWLVAWTVGIPAAIRRSRAVLATVFGPDPVPRDYATAGGGLLGLRPRTLFATSSELVAAKEDIPALVARYGSLRMPVGILFGRGDRVLDYHRHGELTAREIPHARLELIEGGHMLPLATPDRVAAFIREIARDVDAS